MKRLIEEFNLNLDLAVEAHDLLRGAAKVEIPGVKEEITREKVPRPPPSPY